MLAFFLIIIGRTDIPQVLKSLCFVEEHKFVVLVDELVVLAIFSHILNKSIQGTCRCLGSFNVSILPEHYWPVSMLTLFYHHWPD